MPEHVHDGRGGWFCGGANECGAQHEAKPSAFDDFEPILCYKAAVKIKARDGKVVVSVPSNLGYLEMIMTRDQAVALAQALLDEAFLLEE